MRIDDPICCKGADRAGDAYLTEVWICLHLGEHVAMRTQTMDVGRGILLVSIAYRGGPFQLQGGESRSWGGTL